MKGELSMDREKDIESYLVRQVEKLGGIALKYANGVQAGYPDRFCLLPEGKTFWVELKRKGESPRPLQLVRIRKLRKLGATVYVADSRERIDELIGEMTA